MIPDSKSSSNIKGDFIRYKDPENYSVIVTQKHFKVASNWNVENQREPVVSSWWCNIGNKYEW